MMINRTIPLTILLLAIIVGVPVVYSAVEPHILINMEAGQTTKPFQIKDSFGVEKFSVDVDGTIFPTQGGGASFGTEIVALDDSGNTGSQYATSDEPYAREFTMPSGADMYTISAVEVQTGTIIGHSSDGICVAVMKEATTGTLPLVASTYQSLIIVASGVQNLEGGGGTVNLQPSTIYKIPTASLMIKGGEKLVVAVNDCIGAFSTTTFVSASGATGVNSFAGGSSMDLQDDSRLYLGLSGYVFSGSNSDDLYLKVYAEPVE